LPEGGWGAGGPGGHDPPPTPRASPAATSSPISTTCATPATTRAASTTSASTAWKSRCTRASSVFGERQDPEFLKHLFETTEILRKPITGIISVYRVLPYILVDPQEEQPHRSVEIRGKIKVSPRLVLAPGRAGQTYGELFKEHEVMDQTLVARVFSFMYSSRHQVQLESEDLNIQRSDRNPQAQIERALDEL